jgi:hypothetical protein
MRLHMSSGERTALLDLDLIRDAAAGLGCPIAFVLENLLEILGLAATTLYNRLKQVGIDGVAR